MDSQRRSWSEGGLPWTSVWASQGSSWGWLVSLPPKKTVNLHCNLTIYTHRLISKGHFLQNTCGLAHALPVLQVANERYWQRFNGQGLFFQLKFPGTFGRYVVGTWQWKQAWPQPICVLLGVFRLMSGWMNWRMYNRKTAQEYLVGNNPTLGSSQTFFHNDNGDCEIHLHSPLVLRRSRSLWERVPEADRGEMCLGFAMGSMLLRNGHTGWHLASSSRLNGDQTICTCIYQRYSLLSTIDVWSLYTL